LFELLKKIVIILALVIGWQHSLMVSASISLVYDFYTQCFHNDLAR